MKRFVLVFLALVVAFPPGRGESQAAAKRKGRILTTEVGDGIGSLRPDGSGHRSLVEGEVLTASWSPDKSLIAYTIVGESADSPDLHVVSADGTGDRTLVEDVEEFSWSPQGDHLAYPGRDGGLLGTCGLWIVDVHSANKRMIAEVPDCAAAELAWSPRGDAIVFVNGGDPGSVELERDIYSADVYTGEVTQLTDAPGVDRDPEWSPKGAFIVFESSRDRDRDNKAAGGCFRRTEIYRMRSDGSRQKRLSGNLRNPDCDPSWSPDGRRITWTTQLRKRGDGNTGRPPEVRVASRNGSEVFRITNGRRMPSSGADFSPDGRRIVFLGLIRTTAGSSMYSDLFTARPDGSARNRVTRRGVNSGRPDW